MNTFIFRSGQAGWFKQLLYRLQDAGRVLAARKGYVLVRLTSLTPTPDAPTPAQFEALTSRVIPSHLANVAVGVALHEVQQQMFTESFEAVYGQPYTVRTQTNETDASITQPSIH